MKFVFSIDALVGILNSMVTLATPFLYAAIGKLFRKPPAWSIWVWTASC